MRGVYLTMQDGLPRRTDLNCDSMRLVDPQGPFNRTTPQAEQVGMKGG
jgi:hypothetical protein